MPNFNESVVIQVGNDIGLNSKSNGTGVAGVSETWVGVYGESHAYHGVQGKSTSAGQPGVVGLSENQSNPGPGVYGESNNAGVVGKSSAWIGVYGETSGTGSGVWGKGPVAGVFEGLLKALNDLEVGGNLRLTSRTGDIQLANADCAEHFTVAGAEEIDPGTVMVLGPEGVLRESSQAYDRRVAGVISGAGDYRPGIVLDSQGAQPDRMPVALVGKVFCKVDARYGPVEIGDLLTTSPTPGYAMKVADPAKAFGAVIGKALRPLDAGQELIPVLVALQ
jgi:hypothetical protein